MCECLSYEDGSRFRCPVCEDTAKDHGRDLSQAAVAWDTVTMMIEYGEEGMCRVYMDAAAYNTLDRILGGKE